MSFFSSIQHLLSKRLSELEGFDAIVNHIQKGNRVLSTYPESSWGYKFQKPAQLGEEGRIIRVTVNREPRLLEDDNGQEIENKSGCKHRLVFRKDIEAMVSPLELRFGYEDL